MGAMTKLLTLLAALALLCACAADPALDPTMEELLSNIDTNSEDIRNYVDLPDFHAKVGVSYDQWLEHARPLDPSDLEELAMTVDEVDNLEDALEITAGSKQLFFKFIKKAASTVSNHVKKAVSHVKQVVTKGLDYFKQKAAGAAQNLLKKILAKIQWKPEQYWAYMTRHEKDFTGTQIDTNDDYGAFHKHADAATQNMLNAAYKAMPHQDKCDPKRSGWNEYHLTPFSEIAKMPNGPFSVAPFKYQYQNDPTGYFQEPCNAISNGYFLSIFNQPELKSVNNCGKGSKTDPFAKNCIDDDHMLQVVTAAMPFGSWFMHGSGGYWLGGFLDVKGMDIQFYYMYRMLVSKFIKDPVIARAMAFPACNKKNVPDQSDGINWVVNGERMCHKYWARQAKLLLTNTTLIKKGEETSQYAIDMLKGLPDMGESIAGIVILTLRAVFHKKFPAGQKIFETISNKLVDALMKDAPQEVRNAAKGMVTALHEDKVLGFENPHDGLTHVLNILADFMDAMFFQESGKFGPGTKELVRLTPPDAGCTLAPHATWHRKATRVISAFIALGKSPKVLSTLKEPNSMVTFKMGIPPTGIYMNLIKDADKLFKALQETFNMKTLAGYDFTKGPDILNVPGFINFITKKYGKGWPKKGDFVGDKWPKCTCKRKSIKDKCESRAVAPGTRAPVGNVLGEGFGNNGNSTKKKQSTTPKATPKPAPKATPKPAPKATPKPTPKARAQAEAGAKADAESSKASIAASLAQKAADAAKKAADEATAIANKIKKLQQK